MSDYKWEEILRNSVVNNTIKAKFLQHIPKLKTCENWGDVNFLGRVHYEFQNTVYNGGLVKLNGKIYYINIKQIQAVSNIIKWNTSNVISVVDED